MEKPDSGPAATLLAAFLRPFIGFLDKGSLPKYKGAVPLPGLKDKVKVSWQAYGIPHVYAGNEEDLFLAQGYLHAQERLWQMDMSRRFLAGRLAEIFGVFPMPWRELSSRFRGRDSADFDYFMRLMGIRRAALASLDVSSELEHRCLQAYSDGVNRYIEQCGKKLPWEFRLLRYDPDPWGPEDSLLIGKGLGFLLSTALFTRLNMIAIAAQLADHPELLRSLFPAYPDSGPTITRALWDSSQSLWRFMNGALARCDWSPAGHGSNNWVVAPSRSSTGRAILCNDPHLRLTVPSIWYLMHLQAAPSPIQPDGYEVWGASIPGSPCIQLGHNRWIAWGATAAVCDDVELFREKPHPLDSERYRIGHRWFTLEKREETIRLRSGAELTKTVRSTCHGPLLSDFGDQPSSAQMLSLRWTAHEPSRELYCIYGVNRARNWHEFLDSLSFQAVPTLNYVYADCDGNIGYSLAGKIPLRARVPTLLPVDGWIEANEWRGYIPFTELPRLYNPPEGVIATANNRIVDTSYPRYFSHFFDPPHRIRRIQQLLARRKVFSVSDMDAMQGDVVSLHATGLIQTLKTDLAAICDENRQTEAAAHRLLGWDGACEAKSVEAAIFHVFHHRLMANLLLPVLGEELFPACVEIFNQALTPIDQILKDPESPWFSMQSRQRLVVKSLRETCEELETALGADLELWEWGKIHRLLLNHSLGRVKLLRPVVSLGPFSSPGSGTTINMGYYRHTTPYAHTVGASLRFVIDVGSWEQSGFVLPSGQSGHPFSPHYRNQTEHWSVNRKIKIEIREDKSASVPTLTLAPPAIPLS
jgi:penicillin G amidase